MGLSIEPLISGNPLPLVVGDDETQGALEFCEESRNHAPQQSGVLSKSTIFPSKMLPKPSECSRAGLLSTS